MREDCKKDPVPSKCWPTDQDYLDGKTEIELPPEHFTRVFWDTDILDLDDKNQKDTIIGADQAFKVRFRVELQGKLWQCIAGDWVFDVAFTAIGREQSFYLSLLVNDPNFEVKDWKGCDPKDLCIERFVNVPPGTIQLQGDTQVFTVAATLELRCCSGHIAVAGYENLKEYQFFKGA
jgi:hypothetical protein